MDNIVDCFKFSGQFDSGNSILEFISLMCLMLLLWRKHQIKICQHWQRHVLNWWNGEFSWHLISRGLFQWFFVLPMIRTGGPDQLLWHICVLLCIGIVHLLYALSLTLWILFYHVNMVISSSYFQFLSHIYIYCSILRSQTCSKQARNFTFRFSTQECVLITCYILQLYFPWSHVLTSYLL